MRALAADARAREPARCTLAEPLRVRGAGRAPDARDRLVYAAINYLVAPNDVDDALRAADRRRDAVAGTVDIYDAPVGRERVGGKKEEVAHELVVANLLSSLPPQPTLAADSASFMTSESASCLVATASTSNPRRFSASTICSNIFRSLLLPPLYHFRSVVY